MPLFALQPTRASRDQSKDKRTVGVDLLGMIASGPVSEVHFERQATVEMGMPNGDRLVSRRRKLISTHMCVNAITAGRCRPKCATSTRVSENQKFNSRCDSQNESCPSLLKVDEGHCERAKGVLSEAPLLKHKTS